MHQPTFPRPPIILTSEDQIPGQMTIDDCIADAESEEEDEAS